MGLFTYEPKQLHFLEQSKHHWPSDLKVHFRWPQDLKNKNSSVKKAATVEIDIAIERLTTPM